MRCARGQQIKTAWDCRAHAAECRTLAYGAAKDFREELLEMADLWEDLARDHEGASKHPAAEGIKAFYDHVARQPVPPKFLELLRQLEEEAVPRAR
jgi:hypothetical protein